MLTITLPDNSQRKFDHPVSIHDIAASIGAGLAKAALAGKVDDQLVDTSYIVKHDAKVSIITDKDPEGLEVIRHSTAHLLAHAVKQLFPSAQVTIGPVIDNGFYYDFAFERTFTPEDLQKIEQRMTELAEKNIPVLRSTLERDEAVKFFVIWVKNIKRKLLNRFLRVKFYHCIIKMILPICAVGRTCRRLTN